MALKSKTMIAKNFNGISYAEPDGLTKAQAAILRWAITAYAFVMFPRTSFTFGDLAKEIPNHFDATVSQTAEAIQILEAAQKLEEAK